MQGRKELLRDQLVVYARVVAIGAERRPGDHKAFEPEVDEFLEPSDAPGGISYHGEPIDKLIGKYVRVRRAVHEVQVAVVRAADLGNERPVGIIQPTPLGTRHRGEVGERRDASAAPFRR